MNEKLSSNNADNAQIIMMEQVLKAVQTSITSAVPVVPVNLKERTYHKVDECAWHVASVILTWQVQQLLDGNSLPAIAEAMQAGPAVVLQLLGWLCKQVPANFYSEMMAQLDEETPSE